ncbi:MAG: hypothetical protein WBV94_14600 [Blastocatellia bacterium]
MIRIDTEGPTGEKYKEWSDEARRARAKMLGKWKADKKNVPNLDQHVWKKLKQIFLNDLFHKKCAYCEGKVSGHFPLDVEHYRPKKEVTEGRVAIEHQGYFWLAYEWYNLILACRDCNSYHSYCTNEDENDSHPGKANEFRITGKRVCEPADDPETWQMELQEEKPLLLNPYLDYPEKDISFKPTGTVYPNKNSERGRETIEVCHLNRPELVEARMDATDRLFKKMNDEMSAPTEGYFFSPSDPYSAWLNYFTVLKLKEIMKRYGHDLDQEHQDASLSPAGTAP